MRNTAKPAGSLTDQQKLDNDVERFEAERNATLITGGMKGLAVLNSAGVAAMLASCRH